MGERQETLDRLTKILQPAVVAESPEGPSSPDLTNTAQLLPLKEALRLICPEPPELSRCRRILQTLQVVRKCCACAPCRRCRCQCLRRRDMDEAGAHEVEELRDVREAEEIARRARRRTIARQEGSFSKHDC